MPAERASAALANFFEQRHGLLKLLAGHRVLPHQIIDRGGVPDALLVREVRDLHGRGDHSRVSLGMP
jgi:hypothetical protein